MKNSDKTIVIFRKYKQGDVIALFPTERADNWGNILSYQRVGQHGAADYNGVVFETTLATFEEYASLKRELEGRGYNLEIRKRKMK